jgi:tetratricopeptide (TPR) repeat protein
MDFEKSDVGWGIVGAVTNRRLAFAVALAAAVLGGAVTPRDAAAQTASEITLARQWFADGRALEDKGDWAGALEQFKRAAQVKRTPQILYHLGLCASHTGKLVQAMVDLDAALTLARSGKVDDVVAVASAELAEVKKRVASVEIKVEGKDPSRLVVDGQSVALAAIGTAMPLDPGEHTITVDLASGATATKKVTLAEKDAQKLVLVPEGATTTPPPIVTAPPPGPATHPMPVEPPKEAPASGGSSALGWGLVIGGAAVFAGGVTMFAVARGKAGDLAAQCPEHKDCDPALESDYDSAKTLNTLGVVLGAAGVVAAGVGVTLLVVAPSMSRSSDAAVVITPRGLLLNGHF